MEPVQGIVVDFILLPINTQTSARKFNGEKCFKLENIWKNLNFIKAGLYEQSKLESKKSDFTLKSLNVAEKPLGN